MKPPGGTPVPVAVIFGSLEVICCEVDHVDGIVYVDRLPDDERAAILAV